MSVDDVADLLAEQLGIVLGTPVKVIAYEPARAVLGVGDRELSIDADDLERIKADIDKAAPPLPLGGRARAALVIAALVSGALDGVATERSKIIGAAVRPHAERLAQRCRAEEVAHG